jgi:hypothetical protein
LKGFKVADYISSPFPKLAWRNRSYRRRLARRRLTWQTRLAYAIVDGNRAVPHKASPA